MTRIEREDLLRMTESLRKSSWTAGILTVCVLSEDAKTIGKHGIQGRWDRESMVDSFMFAVRASLRKELGPNRSPSTGAADDAAVAHVQFMVGEHIFR
jgi:hypothetical protein